MRNLLVPSWWCRLGRLLETLQGAALKGEIRPWGLVLTVCSFVSPLYLPLPPVPESKCGQPASCFCHGMMESNLLNHKQKQTSSSLVVVGNDILLQQQKAN